MGDDAARFRKRARECRELAQDESDRDMRRSLLTVAKDLEKEADEIDRAPRPPQTE